MAPERANYWLQEMIHLADTTTSKQQQYDNNNNNKRKKKFEPPRASLYTSVIAAWERSGLTEAPQRGEAVFQQMVENAPGNITAGSYYLLISLFCKSNLPEAPEKAEELLRQMIDKSRKDSRLYPSCQAFVNVIMCWKRTTRSRSSGRSGSAWSTPGPTRRSCGCATGVAQTIGFIDKMGSVGHLAKPCASN